MNALFSKKVVAAVISATALFAGATAQAATEYPDFQVKKPGPFSNGTFTADRIVGDYIEIASFNQQTGTFQVSLQWTATGFTANSESANKTTLQANKTGLGVDYGLYALYTASGTFSQGANGIEFFFTPNSGDLKVYMDNGVDSTFGEPATGATEFTVNAGTPDTLLAEGDPLFGYGLLQPNAPSCGAGGGINCGSFGSTTSFNLTPAGENFFFDPSPFYNLSFQSGNLNNFDPIGRQRITGLLNVSFERAADVPEPASLGLLGLGLLGLGAVRRRKQVK